MVNHGTGRAGTGNPFKMMRFPSLDMPVLSCLTPQGEAICMAPASVRGLSVPAQEDIPTRHGYCLDGNDQPKTFEEALLAGFVVKELHADECSDRPSGECKRQQDALGNAYCSGPGNQLVVSIRDERDCRYSGQPGPYPVKCRQIPVEK